MQPQQSDCEIILGIDPGSLKTGFGLVEKNGNSIVHVAHGTIILNRHSSLPERLQNLACDLSTLIKKYQPQRAVVEDVFVFKNPRSALILGQARGAVLAVFGLHNLPLETFSATRVKSIVAGKGQAQKFQVAQFVAMELGIDPPKSPDASDALALALACAHVNSGARPYL